jgi:hypothetical protein
MQTRDVITISSYNYKNLLMIEHIFLRMTLEDAKKHFRAMYPDCSMLLIDVEYGVLED